jgi:hypothetical protein
MVQAPGRWLGVGASVVGVGGAGGGGGGAAVVVVVGAGAAVVVVVAGTCLRGVRALASATMPTPLPWPSWRDTTTAMSATRTLTSNQNANPCLHPNRI